MQELLLLNLFNHRKREEHDFTLRADFYTVILLHKDICMCQITREPFSPSAALCFSVEGKKRKLKRLYIVDATHQDAYLRIKHKVLFSLTYITVFAKLQSFKVFIFTFSQKKPCGMNKEGKEDSHAYSIICFKGLKAKHRNPSKSRGKRGNVTLLYRSQLKCSASLQRSCIWLMRPGH